MMKKNLFYAYVLYTFQIPKEAFIAYRGIV